MATGLNTSALVGTAEIKTTMMEHEVESQQQHQHQHQHQHQQQQPQPQKESDAVGGYAFSSAAFRKKKQGKKGSRKLRNKKFITKEEAESRGGRSVTSNQQLSRSLSTSALLPSRKTSLDTPKAGHRPNTSDSNAAPVATPPSAVVPAASVVSIFSGSPIGSDPDAGSVPIGGQREHELDLLSPARLRNTRKPWETDIRKKDKTEYGDSILRDGPSSTGRVDRRSTVRRSRSLSVSKHGGNIRSRSLSTSHHRSFTAHRLNFENQPSSASSSGSEDDPCDNDNYDDHHDSDGNQGSSDEDKTYEKYRQFLASTKSNDNDEVLSHQSVSSLKRKVGAAPSLSFSYRYSVAADELLGLRNGDCDDDGNTDGDEGLKSTEHKTDDASEPDDLASRNKDTETVEEQPLFLGDVYHDIDAGNDNDIEESRSKAQGSSPVMEQESNLPMPSPLSVSSPHPPSLAHSSSPTTHSPTTHSPTPTASTKGGLPPPPITKSQQQQQQEEKTPAPSLSSRENKPYYEEESSCSSERDSNKVDRDGEASETASMATSEEGENRSVCGEGNTSTDAYRDGYEDGFGDPSLVDSSEQEDTEGCLDDEPRPRDEAQDCRREDDSYGEDHHHRYGNEIDDSSEGRHGERAASATILVGSPAPGFCSEENDLRKDHPQITTIQGRLRVKEDGHGCVDKSRSTKTYNDNDDVDDDRGKDSSFQDEEDPDYPEEDRQLLSLLYHIHTS